MKKTQIVVAYDYTVQAYAALERAVEIACRDPGNVFLHFVTAIDRGQTYQRADAIHDELPLPLVVKPAQGGSAQGVTIVDDAAGLPRAMVDAYTYSDVAIIEQRIAGTEIAIGIIDTGEGPVALPAVEIEPLSGVYSFEARYNAGETRFYTPARISDDVAARAASAASRFLQAE